jgi:hypothetical protein
MGCFCLSATEIMKCFCLLVGDRNHGRYLLAGVFLFVGGRNHEVFLFVGWRRKSWVVFVGRMTTKIRGRGIYEKGEM